MKWEPNKKEGLDFLKELLRTERLEPVIDRRYHFSAVAEASRDLEEGHAQGKIVITLKGSNKIEAIVHVRRKN